MSEWVKVGMKIPGESKILEVVGYWTICCEEDAEHQISIRLCKYSDGHFVGHEGYFILPLFYRVLGDLNE